MRIDSTECNDESKFRHSSPMQYAYSLLLDSAGETVALVARDGLDALLDMDQRLGVKGSSATAGGKSSASAFATCQAKAASRILRWMRRNRGRAIRSCSRWLPEACERGRQRPPDRGLL